MEEHGLIDLVASDRVWREFRFTDPRVWSFILAYGLGATPLGFVNYAAAIYLSQALGKDPEIETRIDPAILGGIKVQVGSRLFDASLKSKLDSLKFALKRA